MDIEDMHPLRKEAFIEDIWPCLRICFRSIKRKPDFKEALRICFRKNMNLVTAQELREQQKMDKEKEAINFDEEIESNMFAR